MILKALQQGLSAQRIWQDLAAEHGFAGSYDSVKRFIRRLGSATPLPFRRIECLPWEEAQVDFGTGAPIVGPDGRRRRTHVFRMVLSHSRKGHGRRPLPDDLPVEEVIYPLEDTTCPCCGESMRPIGTEVSEELDYHPGSLFKRRHVRTKYACRKCQEGIAIAPLPPRPIDKGIAGPGLLAYVLTSKYADHIPLNRLQGLLRRHRVELGVASLCDWVGRMADLLWPVYEGLRAALRAGHLIQSDDTPVPYLLDSLKKETATGYLYTYLNEPSRLVVYDFTTSHSRAGPSAFLSGFSGTLLTDGHSCYHEVVQRNRLLHGGCWSHARRKFYDARLEDRRRCGHMLKRIQDLFAVERKAQDAREDPSSAFGDAEHLALRRAESAARLDEIRSCADAWSVEVLPGSGVGQAADRSEAGSSPRGKWAMTSRMWRNGDRSESSGDLRGSRGSWPEHPV